MKSTPKRKAQLSGLDAAARLLASTGKGMRCGELVAALAKRRLWKSPKGKTPEATLNAAIGREIKGKGREARFKKVGRGVYAAAARRAKR